jgi:erythromycin esterase-like protein
MDIESVVRHIAADSIPFHSRENLQPLIDAASGASFVLLGEASHGTSEYYALRAEISKRLITEHGFNFIAVEGDWPACFAVNRYIQRAPGAPKTIDEALSAFERWPQWMWANEEIKSLVGWLREYNDSLPQGKRKVGFYGIDVYSLWESLDEIIAYLEHRGSPMLEDAKKAFACFEAHDRDEQSYAVSAGLFADGCEEEVVELLTKLRSRRHQPDSESGGFEQKLSEEVNALVAVNAEKYYRTMVKSDEKSWNVRDTHMVEALGQIASFYGSGAKAIVWEHNTHIGDARATDMAEEGMVNVGQLVRERRGEEHVFAIGFGSHRGTVIAAASWGSPAEIMQVPPGVPNSWEDALHRAGAHDKLLLFRGNEAHYPSAIPHRAIGVVYHPEYERRGNYVPTVLPKRYDAFVYIDLSHALHPLSLQPAFAGG